MNRPLKILFGIASFFPIASYLLICAVVMGNRESFSDLSLDEIYYKFGAWTHIALIYLVFVLMNVYGLMGYYIYHVTVVKKFRTGRMIGWIAAIFLGNIVAYPIYYFKHILGKEDHTHRGGRIFLGILTILPLGLVIALIPMAVISPELPEPFIMTWAFIFDVIFFPTWIYLIVKVIRNKDLSVGKRVGWVALILFFAFITMPIYWYRHLRKTPP